MSEHTKEPWHIGEKTSQGFVYVFSHPAGGDVVPEAITKVMNTPVRGGEVEANARRIVACVNALANVPNPEAIPDVIAALSKLLAIVDDEFNKHPAAEDARAALAKLAGEGK